MSSKTGNLKFKRLKEYDTIWHPDSTLVFKSATEKFVVGRYVDGVMVKLDNKALEICKEWKFKYDETILIDEEVVDSVVEDEDAEEGGEEDEEGGEDEEEGGEEGGEDEEGEDEDEEVIEDKVVVEKEEAVVEKDEAVVEKDDFPTRFVFLNKYLNELSTSVDSHKKNTDKKIDVLNDDILKRNKEYDLLKNKYDNLEDQYIKLKAKFDGIKNFFS
jgi:hypothetical protein